MFRSIVNSAIVVFTFAAMSVIIARYGIEKETFYGDGLGYYVYLPSAFIYHNVSAPYNTGKKPSDWIVAWSFDNMKKDENARGCYLNQYTYGVALMEAPFFFIAHAVELARGQPADGYSATYSILIKVSAVFYFMLGSLLVYLVLRRYFGATQSLSGLSILLLATNLFWFTAFQAGMAHVPLYFLYAALMYITVRLYDRPGMLRFLLAGFIAGLITLIRPTDILCMLIPLLYGVKNRADVGARVKFLAAHGRHILIAAAAFILPLIPQLLYWKAVTGHYVTYSYGTQSFDFSKPRIFDGLFGFSNGWLSYSPAMGLALLGLIFFRRFKDWMWCIVVILPVYIYIIYSWYCYNYINGFGSRPMIHMYPLLALPLTAFLDFCSRRRIFLSVASGALIVFFVALNISESLQKFTGILDTQESNMAFNLETMFHTKLSFKNLTTKDIGEIQPDTGRIARLCTLACNSFEDSVSDHYVRDPTGRSKYIYHMKDTDYLEVAVVPYDPEKFRGARWFKCSGRFLCTERPDYYKHLLVLTINDQQKLWRGGSIENKIIDPAANEDLSDVTFERCVLNKWGYVSYFARVPGKLQKGDVIKLIMWTANKREIYIDDLCLELYK